MTQKDTKVRVGDKVRYTGESWYDLTNDKIYEVTVILDGGFYVHDDEGIDNFLVSECYEPVADQDAPRIWREMTDTSKPHMTLPNGDVLYEGDYGVTRDGRKVGPLSLDGQAEWPFSDGKFTYRFDGSFGYEENKIWKRDIIAKWVDQDGPKLWCDMTDAEKGALLLAHQEGKVIEFYVGNGRWEATYCDPCEWAVDAYRIKPEPKKPREWWIVGGCEAWDSQQEAVDNAPSIGEIVHVREVMEGEE